VQISIIISQVTPRQTKKMIILMLTIQ